MSARKLLEAAIAAYGSEQKLGDAIGFSQNAVSVAKRRGSVTWGMATAIHFATNGKFNCNMLCPAGAVSKRRKLNGWHRRTVLVRKRTDGKRKRGRR
jgi:hypothetical protein